MNLLVIDREDLKHNIKIIKKLSNSNKEENNEKNVKIIAVVKKNGYGLDIVQYTKFLIDNGIDFFAVCTVEEALKLRENGINSNIIMISTTAIKKEVELLVKNDIIISIGSEEDGQVADGIGKKLNKKVRAHLKIDTGFGRYGFIYTKKEKIVDCIKTWSNIQIEGIFSHFSLAFYKKEEYTKKQFERFMSCIQHLKQNGIKTGMLHICNSSAFVRFPYMHLDAVRLGSIFLGRLAIKEKVGLRKIAYLKSNVSEIKIIPKGYNIGYSNSYKTKRETKIAIIPCGYADGFNVKVDRDMFRKRDYIRYIVRDIKDFIMNKHLEVKIRRTSLQSYRKNWNV